MTLKVDLVRLLPNRWAPALAVCLAQAGIICLPFLYHDLGPPVVVLVLLSAAMLVGSTTLAVLYLCAMSIVVPTWFFDDYLTLPLDFKFYEGLFVLVAGLAGVSWMLAGRLT